MRLRTCGSDFSVRPLKTCKAPEVTSTTHRVSGVTLTSEWLGVHLVPGHIRAFEVARRAIAGEGLHEGACRPDPRRHSGGRKLHRARWRAVPDLQ